jgi:hypothetical protein
MAHRELPSIAGAVALLAGALVTATAIATAPARTGEIERPALSDSHTSGAEGRVEVLFLGHTRALEATDPKSGGWYHDSDRFAPMLKAALAPYGFNFSYTTDTAVLDAANLAKYDALLIYSNHRAIEPAQEKALLDFVAAGKGLLALHSASFCFQNSKAYVGLLGAQFARHGSGEFTATLVNPSHPVLTGVQAFQVFDETSIRS